MNKLSALYNVMKNVQDMKSNPQNVKGGSLDAKLTFGEDTIASAQANCECEDKQCKRQAQLNYGEETMKFERTGASDASCCRPIKGMKGSHFHSQTLQAEACCSPQSMKGHRFNKLSHAMFMIKLLDLTQYEALDNGQKVLSLDLTIADMPKNMQTEFEKHLQWKKKALKSMMAGCCDDDCCEESCGCNCHCHCGASALKWAKQSGLTKIDIDSVMPESLQIRLVMDAEAKPETLTIQMLVQAKTLTGELKPLRLSLTGKML